MAGTEVCVGLLMLAACVAALPAAPDVTTEEGTADITTEVATALPSSSDNITELLPCGDHACPEDQRCSKGGEDCSQPACAETQSCRPSCEKITCEEGHTCKDGKCIEDPPNTDECTCDRGWPCVNGQCPVSWCGGVPCFEGTECFLNRVHNTGPFPSPAIPIQAHCVPIDKCRGVRCEDGFLCEDGQCRPKPTCDTVKCGPGYYCEDGYCILQESCKFQLCEPGEEYYLQQQPCTSVPCPRPVPTCTHNRCDVIRCLEGYTCVDGECVHKNTTCVGYNKCDVGEECYLQSTECADAPCPHPTPACRKRADVP